uniref:Bacteriorhodopsin-like protein n=1 Tax=viral metagenome TaxID=1070528 RepID=A0A6C0DAK7_9ZZZZ
MSSYLKETPHTENNKMITDANEKKPANDETTKYYLVKSSFMITYILLLTTGLITFIEAMRTQNPLIRHIFNLETCISLVAGYFYSVFVGLIDQYEREHVPIDWDTITKNRYIDWAITTPMMLLVLSVFLASESKTVVHMTTIVLIVIFNYLMLYIGYLGEIKVLDHFTACVGGFIPFFVVFYLIFSNYVVVSKGIGKYWLFLFYLVFWSMYGLVYLLEESYKNIAMNILDCISKCFIGIALWVYYIKIIPQY